MEGDFYSKFFEEVDKISENQMKVLLWLTNMNVVFIFQQMR